jgi:glycogen(starch) synthase
MNILLVADGYPPIPGGLESHVARLARYLHRKGHKVAVVAVAGGGESLDPWEVISSSTSFARVPGLHQDPLRQLPPPWPDRTLVKAIDVAAERIQPNVIHAHGWCAASAKKVAARREIPLVVSLHDYGMLCPLRTLLNGGSACSHVAGLRCFDCRGSNQSLPKRLGLASGLVISRKGRWSEPTFVAVSEAVAKIHRQAGLDVDIKVIPNFIDLPASAPAAVPDRGSILFVGSSAEAKGFAVLRRAHQQLLGRGLLPVLNHVGGVQEASRSLVVESGRLQGSQLADAFVDACVVVVPSVWEEPCPTVALEAMAASRPVVASAIGGLREIVESGVSGYLVPPGDSLALANALELLVTDRERCSAMGLAGRHRLHKFSTEVVGPQIEAAYVSALRHGISR